MGILRAVRGCVLMLLCGVLLVLAVLFVLPDEAPSELSIHLHEKGRLDVGAPSEGFSTHWDWQQSRVKILRQLDDSGWSITCSTYSLCRKGHPSMPSASSCRWQWHR